MPNWNLKHVVRMYALAALGVAFTFAFLFPLIALASEAFPLPDVDPAAMLLEIVTNWKAMGVVGIISGLTLLSAMAVNAWVPDSWKFKRLTVLLIAMVYSGIAAAMAPDGSALASVMGVLVTGLIAKGGASEIYEALKGAGVIKSKSS